MARGGGSAGGSHKIRRATGIGIGLGFPIRAPGPAVTAAALAPGATAVTLTAAAPTDDYVELIALGQAAGPSAPVRPSHGGAGRGRGRLVGDGTAHTLSRGMSARFIYFCI